MTDESIEEMEAAIPQEWDVSAMEAAHKIREAIKSIVDDGTHIDSEAGNGTADLWPRFGGVEFHIQIKPTRVVATKN